MDQVKFKEIRDKLNSDSKVNWVMIYSDGSWGWSEISSSDIPQEGEDLSGIEYNEVAPDWFVNGNLLGFIYFDHACPAVLGYGKRSEEEQKILKYIWKVNHGNSRKESSKD